MLIDHENIFNYNGLRDSLEAILIEAKEEIVQKMKESGKYVTGRTAEAIEIHAETMPDGVQGRILAPISLLTLETGRRDGKIPSNFTYILLQWAINKKLPFKDWQERQKFASNTARKIANFGSRIYRRGRREDVYTSVLVRTDAKIKKMCDDLGEVYDITQISQSLPTTKISFVF